MSSTPIGNSIAVLPDGAGFDVYSASTKYPDVSPTVTILQAPAKSTDFDDTVKTSVISGGYRYSKTAANKRLADPNNPLVAVFYQDTNGYLYETFFTAAGIGAGTVHVNTVPYTGINAPFLGSSLASATFGEGSKNDILFYQASDHRIYFVLRQTYGAWSIPALVTEDPADGKTTLAALSWAEADSNSDIKVDNLCIAFTQSSDRILIYRMRRLRDPVGKRTNSLEPRFERVVDCKTSKIYGPLSIYYTDGHCECNDDGFYPLGSSGRYRAVTQLEDDPPRLWEAPLPIGAGDRVRFQEIVTSATTGLQIPARGTSIATLYNAKSKALTVVYNSPEGWLTFKQIDIKTLAAN